MKTSTIVYHPVLTALSKVVEYLKANHSSVSGQWITSTDKQKEFLDKFLSKTEESNSVKDIQTKASQQVEVLNSFLEENGFSIRLDPFADPRDFGVVSIMNVLVNWLTEGQSTTLSVADKEYPAVYLTDDDGVAFYTSDTHKYPVVKISTKENDFVCMTIADKQYTAEELLDKVTSLKSMQPSYDYDRITFPKISLDREEDISWLLGMSQSVGNDYCSISQALQQTKFKMNEKGARAESAVALGVAFECCMMPKEEVVIDKPFIVWIEREGLSMPLFCGLICEESWKDPGTL